MGRLRRELSDPWGLLLAGVVGGVAGVLPGAGLLIGAGVAAAVYGVKVTAGALFGGPDQPQEPTPPAPKQGTLAAFWLARAERAVRELDEMGRGGRATATDAATLHACDEADAVLTTMRRLGGQVVAVAHALGRAEGDDLDGEAARLRQRAARDPEDLPAQQSAQAVADRIAVRDRLRKAATALESRLQSSALALEGLVARVAEVRAAAATVGQLDPTVDDLAALTSEVEGLRRGLADAEQVAQRALGPGAVLGTEPPAPQAGRG